MASENHIAPEVQKEGKSQPFAGSSYLRLFERFEHFITYILVFILSIVIIVALVRLSHSVIDLLFIKSKWPIDFQVFQTLFGMMLTLIIAMEFRHSVIAMFERKGALIQARIVVLIAIMALGRKFIVVDTKETSAEMIAALASVAVALGVIYWLMCPKSGVPEEAEGRKSDAEARL